MASIVLSLLRPGRFMLTGLSEDKIRPLTSQTPAQRGR
jgi:hypothetical protein